MPQKVHSSTETEAKAWNSNMLLTLPITTPLCMYMYVCAHAKSQYQFVNHFFIRNQIYYREEPSAVEGGIYKKKFQSALIFFKIFISLFASLSSRLLQAHLYAVGCEFVVLQTLGVCVGVFAGQLKPCKHNNSIRAGVRVSVLDLYVE